MLSINVKNIRIMKRYFISFVLLLCSILPMLAAAYDRHGRDYSVKDDGGSSGFLAFLVIIGIVAYGYFRACKKDK